jgi:hypothetical protein
MKELTESKANKKPAAGGGAAAAAPKLSAAEIRMKELAEAGAKGAPAKGKGAQSFFGASSSTKSSSSVCLYALPLYGHVTTTLLWCHARLNNTATHVKSAIFWCRKRAAKTKVRPRRRLRKWMRMMTRTLVSRRRRCEFIQLFALVARPVLADCTLLILTDTVP